MNLASLSNEQLDQNLQALQHEAEQMGDVTRLQQMVQELQVHQIELEMHNRALRDTQAELELSVQRYADLYDNLPLAYLTVTTAGEILAANRAAIEWLHRDRRRLVGSFLGKFLDPYDAGRLAAHLENCLRASEPATMEVTLRPNPGEVVVVQLSSRPAPVRAHDKPRIQVAITDVSKLKHAQGILEEINREQETFNYSISHDLRAPLVTITNYARIVLSEHGRTLDDEARTMVQRMESAALRMEHTLKHLLAYSSLARSEVVLEPISIEEAVHDLLIEHRGVIEKAQADIVVEPPLPVVRGSRTMLNQALANLLTNALKYTPPGETPRVRISAEFRDATAVLKFADQGIGIDPKFHERIFQVFERLHGYSRYPGSGVGLAIARRAMERMHGRIWVESELGKGSCFCLELPKG